MLDSFTQKQKRQAVWIGGLAIIAFGLVWVYRSPQRVHVIKALGRSDGTTYSIDCTLKNPTSSATEVIAISTITHESLNRHRGLVAYPEQQLRLRLESDETKTITFRHPCQTASHRVRHNVTVRSTDR